MAKITLESIIADKYEKEENIKRLKIALTKTKWLEKYKPEEIDISVLEKLYRKVTNKYPGRIGYIQNAGDDSWAFMVRHEETGQWIHTAYAITLFEGIAKTILILYGYFIKGIKFNGKG